MKLIPTLTLVLSVLFLSAQETFSKLIDIDSTGMSNVMIDMDINEDRFAIFSSYLCKNGADYYPCKFISEFDLQGNLQNQIQNDSLNFLNSVSIMGQSCDDCLSFHDDNLYLSVQNFFDGHNTTKLYKYDAHLNLLSKKSFDSAHKSAFTINEGHTIIDSFIYLYDNISNGPVMPDSAQLIKADLDGNEIWRQYYSTVNPNLNINSFQSTHDGNFAFTMAHAPPPGPDGIEPTQLLTKVNSLGEYITSYNFPFSEKHQNRLKVGQDASLYFTSHHHPEKGFDGISYGHLNKVTEDFNTLDWAYRLPNNAMLDGRNYRIEDLYEAKNGNILVCGKVWENSDSASPGADINSVYNGFIIRMTPEGEIMWTRTYRAENDLLPSENFGRFRPSQLDKVIELEDGRIMAAGSVSTTSLQYVSVDHATVETNHMWILVVDENGCLEGFPCQELIRFDDPNQVTPPPFTLGTQWTYEYFPESSSPDEEITSFITYEVTQIDSIQNPVEYIIENNRNLPTLKMQQTENETWFYSEMEEAWQLTYDFNAVFKYDTYWNNNPSQEVTIDTIIDVQTHLGERGFLPVQKVAIRNENQETQTQKEITQTIGSLYGGLTLDNHPMIGDLRCYTQDDFHFNFGPFFPAIACDSMWITFVLNTDQSLHMNTTIYPNPVTQTLNIRSENNDYTSYHIYDVFGKLVEAGKFTTAINVSTFVSGTYILRLFREGEFVENFKIVKN